MWISLRFLYGRHWATLVCFWGTRVHNPELLVSCLRLPSARITGMHTIQLCVSWSHCGSLGARTQDLQCVKQIQFALWHGVTKFPNAEISEKICVCAPYQTLTCNRQQACTHAARSNAVMKPTLCVYCFLCRIYVLSFRSGQGWRQCCCYKCGARKLSSHQEFVFISAAKGHLFGVSVYELSKEYGSYFKCSYSGDMSCFLGRWRPPFPFVTTN